MDWRALLVRLRAAFSGDADATDVLDAAAHVPSGLSRRTFLRTALVGLTAAAVVDVDQLLWTPGEKTIFVPDVFEPVDLDWLAREALRILKNNLAFANHINRYYDARFVEDSLKVGDTIRIPVPQRVRVRADDQLTPVAAPTKAVTLDQHLGVAFDADRMPSRRHAVKKHLEPAMAVLADVIEDRRIDVVTDLALPPTGLPGVESVARAVDRTAGLSLRALQLDTYDIETDRHVKKLRFDLLGASSRPRRRRRRR